MSFSSFPTCALPALGLVRHPGKSEKTCLFPGVHQEPNKICCHFWISSALIEALSSPRKHFSRCGRLFLKTWISLLGICETQWEKMHNSNKFSRYKSKQRCPGCYRDINMKILLAMLRIPTRMVLVHKQGFRRGYTAEPQAFSAQAQGL